MKKIIQNFSWYIFATFLISCSLKTNKSSDKCPISREDSIAIIKDFAKWFNTYDTTIPFYHATKKQVPEEDKTKMELARLFQYSYKSGSSIITDEQARVYHLAYLQSKRKIIDSNGNYIHFLNITQSEFQKVCTSSTNGARLYFCLEPGKNELSIILVPIGRDNENVFTNSGSKDFAIVNKLEPCPDVCFGYTYADTRSFHVTDLNYNTTFKFWYKPNLGTGSHWFSKDGNEQ